jgi:hypothetical protein
LGSWPNVEALDYEVVGWLRFTHGDRTSSRVTLEELMVVTRSLVYVKMRWG